MGETREIRFRAWDLERNCWIAETGTTFVSKEASEGRVALTLDGHLRVFSAHYGGFFDDVDQHITELHDSEYWSTHPCHTKPPYKRQYILMQYTGIKDKNGKRIYEGDVVQDTALPAHYGSVVRWGMSAGIHGWIGLCDMDDAEVIGNIYENPELKVI